MPNVGSLAHLEGIRCAVPYDPLDIKYFDGGIPAPVIDVRPGASLTGIDKVQLDGSVMPYRRIGDRDAADVNRELDAGGGIKDQLSG